MYVEKVCLNMIERNKYLKQLIDSRRNGFPKVVTGIRRCGKSFLLEKIYKDYLIGDGVSEDDILFINLDEVGNASLRNPLKLNQYLLDWMKDRDDCYIFLDEIQRVYTIINPELSKGEVVKAKSNSLDEDTISFVDVILGISSNENVDLYVTGSNSKMLSTEILTQFRDRATNISMSPISFEEFYEYKKLPVSEAVTEYLQYGGMPLAVLKPNDQKKEYLTNLFTTTYFKDIIEHNKLKRASSLDDIANILSECIGQIINPNKLANTFNSVEHSNVSAYTVEKYIDFFIDSFMLREAKRYDIKGRAEIGAGKKYYFSDLGLRNARVNFSMIDEGQLLENMVYNELIYNGYSVNVGVFESFGKDDFGKTIRKNNEIDFYAVKNNRHLYIQVCNSLYNKKTYEREIKPYIALNDEIQKVIVVKDYFDEYRDQNGFTFVGVADFLLRFIK